MKWFPTAYSQQLQQLQQLRFLETDSKYIPLQSFHDITMFMNLEPTSLQMTSNSYKIWE